jgi:hypothetical protein
VAQASRGTGHLLARAVALAIFLGCALAIGRLAQQAPETGAPGAGTGVAAEADGDCATVKRAEIDREKAAGRLTAEQAMIRRQKIARECG